MKAFYFLGVRKQTEQTDIEQVNKSVVLAKKENHLIVFDTYLHEKREDYFIINGDFTEIESGIRKDYEEKGYQVYLAYGSTTKQ